MRGDWTVPGPAGGPARRSTRPATASRSRSSSSFSKSWRGSTNASPATRPKERDMAVQRDHPYAQFNFLVDLGTGDPETPQAGFQECSEITVGVDVIEYRNGNDR